MPELDLALDGKSLTRRGFLRDLGRVSAAVVVPEMVTRHGKRHHRRHHKRHVKPVHAARKPAGAPGSTVGTGTTGSTLSLQSFGAAGNGSTDDTAAIQAALNAASSGTTVMGQAGAVYVITNTLAFPRDGVTLNLGGGAVRIGARRASGSALASSDTMFEIWGRSGVRITNGKILSALSSFAGAVGYRIQVAGGQDCQIDHMTAACDGSLFVYLSGSQHTISSNAITAGGISGLATTNVIVQANTLTSSPSDAINFNGYEGAPVTGTQYLNNVISGYGRVAIEEHSDSGPAYCLNPVFQGNVISAPSASNTSGTGISAISTGATITGNRITDAAGWAIEATGLATTVTGNQISWTNPKSQAALESTAIVINTSLASNTSPMVVSGNTITSGSIGIQLFGSTFYCPVTISSNRITNTSSQGIVLAPAAGTGLIRVANNTLTFNQSPSSTRYGVVTGAGAQLSGNQILYSTSSYRSGTYDIPYSFSGNNVTLQSNVANGGGRTDGYIGSGVLGGSWSGWTLTNNQFINGAPAHLAGLVAPVQSGNVGLS